MRRSCCNVVLMMWLLKPTEEKAQPEPVAAPAATKPRPQGVYRAIFAMPAFWIMLASVVAPYAARAAGV